MLRILITDGLDGRGMELLRRSSEVADRTGISGEELLEIVHAYDGLIVRGRTRVAEPLFQAATALKVVGRAGVGVDNIDLVAAARHGVTVVNAPASTSVAVAELTFGLLLSVARDLPRADSAMKRGEWLKKELEGVELAGKTLGIIGFGRIGAEVGRRGAAFDMTVLAHDPLLSEDEIQKRGGQPVTLEHLYRSADFIAVHVPLDASTRGLLGASAFSISAGYFSKILAKPTQALS